jgi:BatD DUF11 like domain
MRKKIHSLIFLLLVTPALLRSQSVHWDPPGGTLAVGEATGLQLVFDDCEPKGNPNPPRVSGLTLQLNGQSSNISIINGSYSHTVTCNFAALLAQKQAVDIPAFSVETSKGTLTVKAAHFDPVGATVSGGKSLDSAASARIDVNPGSVWEGQVFDLTYSIQASHAYYPDFGRGSFDWNADPLVAEDWSAPSQFETQSNGDPQTGLIRKTRAIAHKPGKFRINPANEPINLSVGVTGFGFFQQRQYQQFSVSSSTPSIEVRELPAAPSNFSKAVGVFKLESKVVPENPGIGDPITWTIKLSGTGNWPDIAGLPSRHVSRDFQIIQPKAKRTPAEGKLFDSSLAEDVVLVPTQMGTYTLDPVQFTYFNPNTGTYETLETQAKTITVSAASPTTAAGPQINSGATQEPKNNTLPKIHIPEPGVLPSGLPRDPISQADLAVTPLSNTALQLTYLLALLLIAASWITFSFIEANKKDPARPKREARVRLTRLLRAMQTTADKKTRLELLKTWQKDAAILWGLPSAAPTGLSITEATWISLWHDTESALYSQNQTLPQDWTDRATTALATHRVASFNVLTGFYLRNLFPFLFSLFIIPTLMQISCFAQAGTNSISNESAYRRGNFEDASTGWQKQVSQTPNDWSARHNLSLALAQTNHWDLAEAEAAAAFVQNPDNAQVRWQLALASEKANYIPGPLAILMTPGPASSIAGKASPAQWQHYQLYCIMLIACLLVLLLYFGYQKAPLRNTFKFWAIICLILITTTLAAISYSALRYYGVTADNRSAIIWHASTLRSIPTEADTAQKTIPLVAGSTGIADKLFLGWIRLRFENGQTGWVRKEECIFIWQ